MSAEPSGPVLPSLDDLFAAKARVDGAALDLRISDAAFCRVLDGEAATFRLARQPGHLQAASDADLHAAAIRIEAEVS